MKSNNLFIKAVVVERDGGFYIQLHDQIAKHPDFPIQNRFESREEAEAAGEAVAHYANRVISNLVPPDWQSPS